MTRNKQVNVVVLPWVLIFLFLSCKTYLQVLLE